MRILILDDSICFFDESCRDTFIVFNLTILGGTFVAIHAAEFLAAACRINGFYDIGEKVVGLVKGHLVAIARPLTEVDRVSFELFRRLAPVGVGTRDQTAGLYLFAC